MDMTDKENRETLKRLEQLIVDFCNKGSIDQETRILNFNIINENLFKIHNILMLQHYTRILEYFKKTGKTEEHYASLSLSFKGFLEIFFPSSFETPLEKWIPTSSPSNFSKARKISGMKSLLNSLRKKYFLKSI